MKRFEEWFPKIMSKVYFCEMYLKINSAEKESTVIGTLDTQNILLGMLWLQARVHHRWTIFPATGIPDKVPLCLDRDGPGQCHTYIRLQRVDLWRQECRSAMCQSWCSNIYCGWNVLLLTIDGYSHWPARALRTVNILLAFHYSIGNVSLWIWLKKGMD